MNRKKIIFGLLTTLLIIIFSLLFVLKITVFNRKYIISVLEKNNYYELVYKETKKTISSYIISSGLSNSVVENIFTKKDIKDNVNNYIDYLYFNNNYKSNSENVKTRLVDNINIYLIEHNLTIENKKQLDDLIDKIINIYDNESIFYNKFNNYVSLFKKLNKIVLLLIIISLLLLVIIIIISKTIISDFFSSSLLSSGLILFFIKFILYDRINYRNILIITEYFSKIITSIFINISRLIIYISFVYILLSVFIMCKEVKRSRKNGRN